MRIPDFQFSARQRARSRAIRDRIAARQAARKPGTSAREPIPGLFICRHCKRTSTREATINSALCPDCLFDPNQPDT